MIFRLRASTLLLLLVPITLLNVSQSSAQQSTFDADLYCYMTTSSGAKIQLDQLCKDYKPVENKNVTVKVLPNGNTETTIVGNEPYTLPDGSIIQLVGQIMRTTWPNGVRSELIPGAKGSGFQYYSPDGKKLLPKQTVQLPDGRVVKQERL